MAQSCDGYSKQTLMGNYYEERWAPNQPFRDDLTQKNTRENDASISAPTDTNQLKPLGRINRNPPWITEGVITDDGFVIFFRFIRPGQILYVGIQIMTIKINRYYQYTIQSSPDSFIEILENFKKQPQFFQKEYRSNIATNHDPLNLQNYKLGDQRSICKTNGNKYDYPENSRNHIQTSKPTMHKMLSEKNYEQVKRQQQVPQNMIGTHTSDFGSTFRKHDETHEKFFPRTAYHDFYQNPQKDSVDKVISDHQKKSKQFAGTNERPEENQSIKAISSLTGEYHKHYEDPKDNTAVQRAWLHNKDKSLYEADKNIEQTIAKNSQSGFNVPPMQTYKKDKDQNLPYDIATSLPLADGMHQLHPQYKDPGEFRHIRSDITRVMNRPWSKK